MKDNQHSYSISDLAQEFDVTTRSIRHYEDYGLICPERSGTRRIYRPKDRVRLQLILRGKRVGFSLAEIKEIIDLYDIPHGEEKQRELLLTKIFERREQLNQQLKDINSMLGELDALERRINPQ
ncbi:MerR family DNA-binding transcriptional regulator [Pleionea sp. CnH1-48]|uniref:MerR family transcriptional regulator n=1 Tax=Pleionea sp. CnH1-48 TaxID=2954494 RepID=UPI0020979A5B|nr:MerR family DNA-binding transcriptional regulator [Pleionea sp. CnH1-48]MCO7226850.1 MerR family DNA-binding transcriptional regulator [Pleionea sp. CnH1-48]